MNKKTQRKTKRIIAAAKINPRHAQEAAEVSVKALNETAFAPDIMTTKFYANKRNKKITK